MSMPRSRICSRRPAPPIGNAPAYTNMGASLTYAQLDALSRAFAAWLQKKSGLAPGRPRRIDDAQHPAVPDRAVRGAARRHGGGEHQSSVHRPRTRASAQGLRRQGDRHRREFRARAAAGVAAYRSEKGVGDPNRRSVGAAARDDREFRAAPRAQTDPGLEHAGRADLQERALVRSRPQARARRARPGGHRIPAIHRRHDRHCQGGDSHPSKHGGERAAGQRLDQAGAAAAGAADRHHRAAALSHIFAYRQLPAVRAPRRAQHPDHQSARFSGFRRRDQESTSSFSSAA